MRTALTLDPDVERLINDEVHSTRRTKKQVVNDTIRTALLRDRPPSDTYSVTPHSSSIRPGFDLAGFNHIADEINDGLTRTQTRIAAMIIVDVNLLLYATITGFPQNSAARQCWEDQVNSGIEVGLTAPAVFGFVRIATNPRVMTEPMSIETVSRLVHSWLARPNIRMLPPTDRHIETTLDLLLATGSAGNLTTDAELAAYALEYDAHMCSNDSDFYRFPGLRWTNPLE